MEINEFNRAVITQEITHDMAEQVALRIISGAFNRTDKRPQFSIPVRPDDDDIILMEYLRRQKSPWLDIESAPKDKYVLVLGKMRDGSDYQEVSKYFHAKNCWPVIFMDGYLAPTHWMPLREPPPNLPR